MRTFHGSGWAPFTRRRVVQLGAGECHGVAGTSRHEQLAIGEQSRGVAEARHQQGVVGAPGAGLGVDAEKKQRKRRDKSSDFPLGSPHNVPTTSRKLRSRLGSIH